MSVKKTDPVRMRARPKGDGRAQLRPIGVIRSDIKRRSEAPKQGSEGAPDAWLEVNPVVAQGLDGLLVGDDIIVVTWLHRAQRDVLKVHPRSDRRRPLTGVFATRSPYRPNPLGLHRVTVRRVASNRLRMGLWLANYYFAHDSSGLRHAFSGSQGDVTSWNFPPYQFARDNVEQRWAAFYAVTSKKS
jgi:tRNA-Thr(GGU) m(6)t(6)A37 methyltransferase TsaA